MTDIDHAVTAKVNLTGKEVCGQPIKCFFLQVKCSLSYICICVAHIYIKIALQLEVFMKLISVIDESLFFSLRDSL